MTKIWTFFDAATEMEDIQNKLEMYCAPLRLAIDALETSYIPTDKTGTAEKCSNTLLLVLFKLMELRDSLQPAIDATYQRSKESKEVLV